MSYNGWKNRATWNVALWAGNNEGSYHYVLEQVKARGGKVSPMGARAIARDLFGDATPDGDKLSGVNWAEIADDFNEMAGE